MMVFYSVYFSVLRIPPKKEVFHVVNVLPIARCPPVASFRFGSKVTAPSFKRYDLIRFFPLIF